VCLHERRKHIEQHCLTYHTVLRICCHSSSPVRTCLRDRFSGSTSLINSSICSLSNSRLNFGGTKGRFPSVKYPRSKANNIKAPCAATDIENLSHTSSSSRHSRCCHHPYNSSQLSHILPGYQNEETKRKG